MITRLILAGVVALPIAIAPMGRQSRHPGAERSAMEGSALPVDAQSPRLARGDNYAQTPPNAWADEDPADSLYRAGREAINRGDFKKAASVFGEISARYPRSEYAPDALYWRAFALYKAGRDDDLREALKSLAAQKSKYPKAPTVKDGDELSVRIRGVLAQQGDADAAEMVSKQATRDVPCRRDNDDDADVRAAAMNALLQMDAENALPIIKQVLQKRDACSIALREKAVFLLSQKQTSGTEDILIDVVKNDPAPSVREQAVFWMGQVNTEKAAAALEQIAMTSPSMELREKAVFALSQQGSSRGMALLRRLAESGETPESVREQAIFWLGQRHSAENADFLKGLLGRLGKGENTDELKKKVLFSLSQMKGFGNDRWLLNVALDTTYSDEVRGHALWSAGQNGVAGSELAAIYDRVKDDEVKEKLIFTLSQSGDAAATDKLVDIAQKDPDREMRKKALFWLGQKNDPRVRKILTDILTKP